MRRQLLRCRLPPAFPQMGIDPLQHLRRISQDLRRLPGVQARLIADRRKAVPLRYNYDKPEKPRTSRVFGYLARFFILFQTEKSSREVVIS